MLKQVEDQFGRRQVSREKALKPSKNAFSAVLSTEGRVVGLCWETQNPKDVKDMRVNIALLDVTFFTLLTNIRCILRLLAVWRGQSL